jgi:hypothetical protein
MPPQGILGGLPAALRDELIEAFGKIITNFREERWEAAGLNAGKLCEVVYSIVRGHADGSFPARSTKPSNMVAACQRLEQETQLPRSLRIQVPRMLVALYEIRNNRGIGHVGGEVDPSHMDAVAVLYMSKWLLAELVRVFNKLDTASATDAVDALIERELQIVWTVGDKKRVLSPGLTMYDKTMLILYSEPGAVLESDLRAWVEAASASSYRRDVLRKAHKAKLLEYDEAERKIRLSPKGIRYVEDNISLILKS